MDLDHYVQPIIEYVRLHQAWAAPIVFMLCFAESLAFLSLLIPAWGVLVALGALISASGIDSTRAIASAPSGAAPAATSSATPRDTQIRAYGLTTAFSWHSTSTGVVNWSRW